MFVISIFYCQHGARIGNVPPGDNATDARQPKNVAWVGNLFTGTYPSEWQIDLEVEKICEIYAAIL
jgi:hypothetical protein